MRGHDEAIELLAAPITFGKLSAGYRRSAPNSRWSCWSTLASALSTTSDVSVELSERKTARGNDEFLDVECVEAGRIGIEQATTRQEEELGEITENILSRQDWVVKSAVDVSANDRNSGGIVASSKRTAGCPETRTVRVGSARNAREITLP